MYTDSNTVVPPRRRAANSTYARRIKPTDKLIVDLGGTLIAGSALLPGAVKFLAQFENRFVIVSNNSTETASRLSGFLSRLGLSVDRDRIILAGEEMIRFAKREFDQARILCATSPSLRRYAQRQGLRLVSDNPDVVLLGRDRTITYDRIAMIANSIRRGAKLVVSNPDANHSTPGGDVVPETGALMSAVVAASGVSPHYVVGKPEPALFLTALGRLMSEPRETVVIGDNPATDGLGAARLGMDSILIGTSPLAMAPSLAAYLIG